MFVNQRREQRHINRDSYSICWNDDHGQAWSVEAHGVDIGRSGLRILCSRAIEPGTVIFMQAAAGSLTGHAIVRHCTLHAEQFSIGVELHEDTRAALCSQDGAEVNYYEFLQISPKADLSVIQRVYRMMAARFHPDNPETGDSEKFLILRAAHDTLSDPQRRIAYDAHLESVKPVAQPIFRMKEFVIGIEGELNRRLGVLALLYNHRRTSPQTPALSLFDLEKVMDLPRELLEFAVWYLRSKQYITFGDNCEVALTAVGADYVESNISKLPILDRLLNSGPPSATSSSFRTSSSQPTLLPQAVSGERE